MSSVSEDGEVRVRESGRVPADFKDLTATGVRLGANIESSAWHCSVRKWALYIGTNAHLLHDYFAD